MARALIDSCEKRHFEEYHQKICQPELQQRQGFYYHHHHHHHHHHFMVSPFASVANDLPSLMEEARLLKLQAQVYQRSGNTEETLKTLTRAKEVQTRSAMLF